MPKLGHAQVLVVGAYEIGGAGKTPFCDWLAQELTSRGYKVAILCHKIAHDEQKLLEKKLSGRTVVATNNRYKAACKLDPDFDIILCDDGFEDSRLDFAQAICLDWGNSPRGLRDLFPAGRARSLPEDHANVVATLFCSGDSPDVNFRISEISNAKGQSFQQVFQKETLSEAPVLVAGIGDPGRFFDDVRTYGINAARTISLRDHDPRLAKTIAPLLENGKAVIITEKDACRLDETMRSKENLFVAKQTTTISDAGMLKLKRIFPKFF